MADLCDISYICVLENKVPKKVFVKFYQKKLKREYWGLIDEFSGYIMKEKHKLSDDLLAKGIVTMGEFTEFYKGFVIDKDATSRGDNY